METKEELIKLLCGFVLSHIRTIEDEFCIELDSKYWELYYNSLRCLEDTSDNNIKELLETLKNPEDIDIDNNDFEDIAFAKYFYRKHYLKHLNN